MKLTITEECVTLRITLILLILAVIAGVIYNGHLLRERHRIVPAPPQKRMILRYTFDDMNRLCIQQHHEVCFREWNKCGEDWCVELEQVK